MQVKQLLSHKAQIKTDIFKIENEPFEQLGEHVLFWRIPLQQLKHEEEFKHYLQGDTQAKHWGTLNPYSI